MKFKILVPVFIFSLFLFNNLKAQDDQIDTLSFSNTGLQDEKPPYFALAAGYTGSFVFTKMNNLNIFVKANQISTDLKSPIYMNGFEAFATIPFIPGLRFSFIGEAGTSTTKDTATTVNRTVDYYVGMNGFGIDYGIVLFKSFAFLPGVKVGWGTQRIESYQNSGSIDFNNINPGLSRTNNYLDFMEATYAFVKPNIGVEYAITPFLAFRLNLGYLLTFSPSTWYYAHKTPINNVTISNVSDLPGKIKPDALDFQFGVFLGLFNY